MAVALKYQGPQLALSVVGIALAVFLIYGGARLLQRRRNARQLLLVWSAVKVLKVLGGTWLWFLSAKEQVAVMSRTAAEDADSGQWTAALLAIQVVGGFLLAMPLPVFFAIWFNRAKIRAEVAEWE
ncbi:MAG: hypothetical protein EXS03_03630 [Phycisphaerales bacterium]|nr:hypothetical protein [Phycisphaerales bacterium]